MLLLFFRKKVAKTSLFLTTLSHFSFSLLFLNTLSQYFFSLLFLTTLSRYSFSLYIYFFHCQKSNKKSSLSKNSLWHLFVCCGLGLVASLVRLSNQFLLAD